MIELGPVGFRLIAKNALERDLANRHVRTARILLGELKAIAGNVGMQSRKVIMSDGTEIAVMRNMNRYTGQAVCTAVIRPRVELPAPDHRGRANGPFMWIGLKDRRGDSGNKYYSPFMSIWEPPSMTSGGRVLVPSLSFPPAPQ